MTDTPPEPKHHKFMVYVAGPYRAPTAFGREENILNARKVGAMLVKQGFFPVIPHANTAHFDGLASSDVEEDAKFWLEGTMELMRRCDAVFLMPNWRNSSGAQAERLEALELGMPVCETLSELAEAQRSLQAMIEDSAGEMSALADNVMAALREIGFVEADLMPDVPESEKN